MQLDEESEIRSAMMRGEHAQAATLLLDRLGPELLGYLRSRVGDLASADDIFAEFEENLWRALPTLDIRTSVRAWAYGVARNAASRHLARERRFTRGRQPLSELGERELAFRPRTPTRPYLVTENKDALRRLRDALSEPEQMLLTLRVDKGFEWREIADALCEDPNEDLDKASARIRKRFEALKRKLRRLAEAEGLLED